MRRASPAAAATLTAVPGAQLASRTLPRPNPFTCILTFNYSHRYGAPFTTNFDYFQFHHSYADMMTHVPLGPYDDAAAAWAIATYGIASLDDLLPRKALPPPPPSRRSRAD